MAKTIDDYKRDWEAAQSIADPVARKAAQDAAHAGAEAIRAQQGYSGGADGSQYIALDSKGGGAGSTAGNATVGVSSAYDKKFMSPEDIASIEYYSALAKSGDKSAHTAAEALRAKYGYSGGADGSQYIPLEDQIQMPAYNSKYSSQIDSLLSAILNREEFSYDHTTDPAYLAYEQQYKRLGDRAREDTLGDAAALNGGYASSWAVSAASQAQNDYNQQLSGIIPQLQEAAYNRYVNDYEMDRSDLGILMDLDNTQYDRYRDTVSDSKWEQEFGLSKDQFDWNKEVDKWEMSNTEATQKFDQLMSKWQLTGVADEQVAAGLGVPVGATTESYYFNKASLALDQAKLAQSNSSANAAKKEEEAVASKNRALAIEEARRAIMSTGSYVDAAKSVIQNAGAYGLDINDYFSICKELGVSDSAAQSVYIDYKNEYLASESQSGVTQDYLYYAGLMGQAEDPEVWLAQNKYSIPADILAQLYNILDY